jgi:glycosyltransferase involved in cell wall biosynthesis
MARRTVEIDSSLHVKTPIAFPVYQGLGEKIVRQLVVGQVRGTLARLDIARPAIFVTLPTFANIALSIPRRSLVYLRSDRHSAYPGVDQALIRGYEQTLFEQADVVAYSNRALFELEAPSLGGKARYIAHGVDTSQFSPLGETDPDIMALPRPLVGFFGELRERSIDFPLVAEVARRLPDVHFVLGGPRLEEAAELRPLPNVHIVDACPHELMPARWRSIDLAMLPYRRSAWQDVCEPIKLLEILATGLTGVGTPLASLRGHPDQISTAETAEAFADAVQWRLAESAGQPRREDRALNNARSWDDIASELLSDARPGRDAAARNPAWATA